MNKSCRLCGNENTTSVILNQPYVGVELRLRDIVADLIKPTKLVDAPFLPQNVCNSCTTFVSSYMEFCDKITKYQKTLAKLKEDFVALKFVKVTDAPEITIISLLDDNILEEEDESMMTPLRDPLPAMTDMTIDVDQMEAIAGDIPYLLDSDRCQSSTTGSYSVAGCSDSVEGSDVAGESDIAESSEAESCDGNRFNLRNKVPPTVKKCSIHLERLPITFVKSDTESDDSESETEAEIGDERSPKASQKRRLDASLGKSPSTPKRMRVHSPIKTVSQDDCLQSLLINFEPFQSPDHRTEPPVLAVLPIAPKHHDGVFKQYFSLFKDEFNLTTYDESRYNFPVPLSARNRDDGSIVEREAKSFTAWSSMQSKCSHSSCRKLNIYQSPYGLLTHYQKRHSTSHEDKFMSCFLCVDALFTFSDYHRHCIEAHYSHLGFW